MSHCWGPLVGTTLSLTPCSQWSMEATSYGPENLQKTGTTMPGSPTTAHVTGYPRLEHLTETHESGSYPKGRLPKMGLLHPRPILAMCDRALQGDACR